MDHSGERVNIETTGVCSETSEVSVRDSACQKPPASRDFATDEPPHDTLLGSDPGSDCSAPCLCVPAAEDGEAFSLGPCAKSQGLWRNSTRGVDESGVVRPSCSERLWRRRCNR